MKTQGRKEIAEAVLIAALTAFATSLVTLGVEEIKKLRQKATAEATKKRKKKKS